MSEIIKVFKDLVAGERYIGVAAVKKCSVGEAGNNKTPFLDLQLTDGTTDLYAKKWDHSGEVPKTNTVIKIDAVVEEYKGVKRLKIDRWRNAEVNEYTPGQFIPKYPGEMETLWKEYYNLRSLVADEEYIRLLDHYIFKPVCADFPCEFIIAPAAKGIHHAYLGGLFEHSVGVANMAIAMDPGHGTSIDLLITAALLHDLGKIEAYKWDGCIIEESDRGKLLGHISLGLMLLTDYAGLTPTFPEEKYILLSHLIASHHGRLEWGSSVEPKTKEAIILHHADMLSFQGNVIDKAVSEAAEGDAWTGKVAGLGREFWVGR